MRFICLICFVFFMCMTKKAICSEGILNDSLRNEVVRYVKNLSKHGNIVYCSRQIRFDLLSSVEDVIKKKYIKGFSYMNNRAFLKEQKLIRHVEDSLEILSKELNLRCSNLRLAGSEFINKENDTYVLLLSPICSGILYAELVNSYGISFRENAIDFSGTVTTYIFKIENSRILSVYKGRKRYEQ